MIRPILLTTALAGAIVGGSGLARAQGEGIGVPRDGNWRIVLKKSVEPARYRLIH